MCSEWHILHLDWFRPVRCKSVSAKKPAQSSALEKAIQQNMIALEMSLRRLLRNFGLKAGAISRGKFEVRIWELADGNPMPATAPMLRAELAALEKQVRQFALDDLVCRRFMTMAGVGSIVALTFRVAVEDPARFRSVKRIGPWVGLTPSRNQSGERNVSGGIAKAEDVNLRRALCQATTPLGRFAVQFACRPVVMMNRGRSTWLRTWGAQLAQRRGRRIAVVALALSIAVILDRIWLDGSVFQPDAAPKMI